MIESHDDRVGNACSDKAYIGTTLEIDRPGFRRRLQHTVLIKVSDQGKARCTCKCDTRHIVAVTRPPPDRIKSRTLQANLELTSNVLAFQVFPRTTKLCDRYRDENCGDSKYHHQLNNGFTAF